MIVSVENKKDNIEELPLHYTYPRTKIEGAALFDAFGRLKNPHNMFATLDGAIKVADKILFDGFLKGCGENRERKNKQLHCTMIIYKIYKMLAIKYKKVGSWVKYCQNISRLKNIKIPSISIGNDMYIAQGIPVKRTSP